MYLATHQFSIASHMCLINTSTHTFNCLVLKELIKASSMKLKAILLSRSVVTNAPVAKRISKKDNKGNNNVAGDDDSASETSGETIDLVKGLSEDDRQTVFKKLVAETNEIDYDDFCDNTTATAFFREDPFICNKYIRCNHGYAQRFKCAKSTAWDIKKRMCLWAQYVKCGKRQLITDAKLLGKDDTDESMKRNGTRYTKPVTTTNMINDDDASSPASVTKTTRRSKHHSNALVSNS